MKGKYVLLTGGTGGLGMGVTPAVLARGGIVTMTYRNAQQVERMKSIVSPADFALIRWVRPNLLDESSVAQVVNEMERVDVLIHLVGGFDMGKTHEYSYEAFQYQLEMNLHTSFLLAKHCLRRMLETGYGRMVMISSRVTEQPLGQMAAYGAAKAGLEGMTRAIAEETKGTNITANVVSPSIIDTPGTRQAMGSQNAVNWVKADSLAAVICFLASEAARDIRGAVVPVYGNT